ncbi:MAG: Nif3-like dinuclear metal center hexameric protein [Candidatus Nanoarchaeia archaeon]|jgi:putative NIF3 family GTP cyclohydrolase 1 type 2
MKTTDLIDKLDNDFKLSSLSDDWSDWPELKSNSYVTDKFKKCYMGLIADNASEIESIYTAVFPSKQVFSELKNVNNALLITHHPMKWDIRVKPAFTPISNKEFSLLKKNKISFYNLHVPLDANGTYSTSVNLARALGAGLLKKEFFDYHGVKVGVVSKINEKTVQELKDKFSALLGHEIGLYNYGNQVITKGLVGFVGGGGLNVESLNDLNKIGVNTLVTGVTAVNSYSKPMHELANKYKINILGGSHYSTEKFACVKLCDYFKKRNLTAQFIEENIKNNLDWIKADL